MHNFRHDFNSIAQCGILDNGGVTRLALTKADHEARAYLIKTMGAAGLEVHIDAVGNIHGVLQGSRPELPHVVIGSHLDTVPHGGHYDGVIGVLAGIEVVRRLRANDIQLQRSVRVISFCAEESSRFGVATLGSKAITGKLSSEELRQITDSEGTSFHTALQQSGCNADTLAQEVLGKEDIHVFLELHIEQGPILEQENIDIGLVTAIAAPSRFDLVLTGRSDHSGTTPMHMRRDALAGAAEVVLAVEEIARNAGGSGVGTVGVLEVEPGAMNVVPGRTHLQIDLRDTNMEAKTRAGAELQHRIECIAQARSLDLCIKTLSNDQPILLDTPLRKRIQHLANALNITTMEMPSGAGHDAMHFAAIAPTALLFIPSIEGVSHNIKEQSSFAAIAVGVELLYTCVQDLTTV
ncbi:MAG: M20 family metallo-hydrolase [Desulfuromonadaceae bacterium]|nr:M20 family metallo-hydrolase [Desulfuromonadaceae bacterium]